MLYVLWLFERFAYTLRK